MSPDSSPGSHATPNTNALAQEVAAARGDPSRQFGRYLVLSELGQGGMGVVYRAWDPAMARLVAIKTLTEGPHASPEMIQRFVIEARSSARLQHPGIIGVHEVGEHQGIHFIAMDLVAGQTLKHHLAEDMASRDALELIRQVALALAHAHAHGVIHRDVKPANVVVNDEGRAILMDFGLAKDLGQGGSLTATGQHLGTPTYMAPEQVDSKTGTVGPAADIYALGVTLYTALCGRPPFSSVLTVQMFKMVLMDTPPPLREINPEVPANLEALVLRCLEKEPANRYPTTVALAEDLGRFLEGKPLEGVANSAPPAPAATTGSPPQPKRPPVATGPARTTMAPAMVVGGALVLVGATAIWALSGSDNPTAPANSDPARPGSQAASPTTTAGTASISLWAPVDGLMTKEPVLEVQGEVTSGQVDHIWMGEQRLEVRDRQIQGQVRLQAKGTDGLQDASYPLSFSSAPQGETLAQVTVVLDRAAPVLEISSPKPDQVVGDDALVEGSVSDPHLAGLITDSGETLVVSEDGRFSWKPPLPADDGPLTIQLTATDLAENSTSVTVSIQVNRFAPVVALTTPENGQLLSQRTVTVQGQVIDAQPTTAWLNSQELEISSDGRFETTVEFREDGAQELRLEAEDASGQRSEPLTIQLVVDRTPPVVKLDTSATAVITTSTRFTLGGRVEDAHLPATLTVGDRQVALDSDGQFSVDISLQEGENPLNVVCLDGAGNAAPPVSLTITCDTTPPTIDLDPPLATVLWGNKRLEVAGRLSEQGCRLTLNGEPIELKRGSFSTRLKLGRGTNLLTLEAMDQAGNRRSLTSQVELLARKPKKPRGTWWEPSDRQLLHAAKNELPLWFENDLGMRFVLIPPGTFLMGSPEGEKYRQPWKETQHPVTLTRGFYIAATEVTNHQGRQFREEGSGKEGEFPLDDGAQPMVHIAWDEAKTYCAWLNENHPVEGRYRLPTEAEWEYACRAGTTTAWHWGNDETRTPDCANVCEAKTRSLFWSNHEKRNEPEYPFFPKDDDFRVSAKVQSFQPNDWGLYDMIGNVAEWCSDWYAGDQDTPVAEMPRIDPRGPPHPQNDEDQKALRGGSWLSPADESRSAGRGHMNYTTATSAVGVRLVLELPWWQPTKRQLACASKYNLPVWFENDQGMRFVLIPPGTFSMGSPQRENGRESDEGQHPVKISRPFYLQTTEVTNAQFRPDDETDAGADDEQRPRRFVSRDRAEEFCTDLGEISYPVAGRYRLPTEAEWEYACRAETGTAWYWGDDLDSAHLYENLLDPLTRRQRLEQSPQDADEIRASKFIPSDDGQRATAPVASYRPNPWGLHDMVGNLHEWTSDAYDVYPRTTPLVDPQGPEERDTFGHGVIRGGAFIHSTDWSRAARRGKVLADHQGLDVGFRLVLVLEIEELEERASGR